MKIAFLGSPEFAIPSLSMLFREGHDLCVFTQPDRPVGRHGNPVPTPVRSFAAEHGIPSFAFEKIRSPEGVAALKAFAPDLMVTAAFGQILSAENLEIPKYGCINVHGSLLPKYRGAAPIQWAVINGEPVTGITTMMTDVGMDTGDILLSRSVEIGPDETAGELYARLAGIGAEVLQETILRLQAGTLERIPQDPEQATKCVMLRKEHGKLDFHESARAVHNRVRGTNPWPGAYAMLDGQMLKIWKTSLPASASPSPGCPEPGTCLEPDRNTLCIQCGDGRVEVLELQAPGGKRMDVPSFLRGRHLEGRVLQ